MDKIKKEKCIGGCGKLSKFGRWCEKRFYDCPGYKNKIRKSIRKTLGITEYSSMSNIYRKEILWISQGKKCFNCSYNLHDYKIGPYQIHHIDGNSKNRSRKNEILLCYNCHFMTNNWGFKGRKHKKCSLKLIGEKTKQRYKTRA